MSQTPPKILLAILVSNGDCLLATVLARQIKKDYPGCHLTWAISDLCRPMINNSPYVDSIWEVRLSSKKAGLNEEWCEFKKQAYGRMKNGDFDYVFPVQIYPDNVFRFDGTTRGTIYNGYPGSVTVDARPILKLTEREFERVKNFALDYELEKYKQVVLFECSSLSGQSFVNPVWAMAVSERLIKNNKDILIFLSTHENVQSNNPRIVLSNKLSLRENAALTHYCSLLIGCSSGITWTAVSTASRRLPMIQFLRRGIGFSFASVVYDHKFWGLDHSEILETSKSSIEHAVDVIEYYLEHGIFRAKERYHQTLRPRVVSMLKYSFMFFRRGEFRKSVTVVKNFIRRNYIRKSIR